MNVFLVVVLAGFLLAGCGNGEKPQPYTPPEVVVMEIQPKEVMLTTELPGRVSAFRVAEIRPQVSGIVQKRFFKEGSEVKAGSVLFQIDPAPFQAVLDNAEASLGRIEANLPAIRSKANRFRELLAVKAVSQQDCDDADAALKQAEADIKYWDAAIKTARINLNYTSIVAPISGRIGRSGVTEGALVNAYQPLVLATIQQLDPIYVDVSQSTSEVLSLKRHLEKGLLDDNGADHNEVDLILEDGTTYSQKGTFQFRDVTVDPTTGSVILRIVFPNSEDVLLPGMFVRAILKEGINREAILIPQQSLFRTPKGDPFALIVNTEDKVAQKMVTLDRAIEDAWLVSSGIAAGDRVIIEGTQKVGPGSSVKVVTFGEGCEETEKKGKSTAQQAAKSN
jgi:membrane fusion protein (multidrug efflux system)